MNYTQLWNNANRLFPQGEYTNTPSYVVAPALKMCLVCQNDTGGKEPLFKFLEFHFKKKS